MQNQSSPVATRNLESYFDTPNGQNLYGEFLETIIMTDADITPTIAQAIWLLVTTGPDSDPFQQAKRRLVADAFMDSTDSEDLAERWAGTNGVLDHYGKLPR
jgi:hypothetical protein